MNSLRWLVCLVRKLLQSPVSRTRLRDAVRLIIKDLVTWFSCVLFSFVTCCTLFHMHVFFFIDEDLRTKIVISRNTLNLQATKIVHGTNTYHESENEEKQPNLKVMNLCVEASDNSPS